MTTRKPIYFRDINDENAIGIGQALAAITKKSEITLCIASVLTVTSARAIAQGLKQSQTDRLVIGGFMDAAPPASADASSNNNNGLLMKLLLEVAVQRIPELTLLFPFHRCDGLATMLSGILWRLDPGAQNHALRSLKLHFRGLSFKNAEQLAVGLRHARIKSLEWDVRLSCHMMPTVYEIVMNFVEKLVLVFELDNETAIKFGIALCESRNTNFQSFKFTLQNNASIFAAEWLARGISHSHIVHLDMDGSCLDEEVEDYLYEMVIAKPSSTIRNLSIGNGFRGTSGLAPCLSKLHTLEIRFQMVTEKLQILMMGLRSAPHFTSLVIEQSFEEEQDVLVVCAALPHLTSLTNLSMSCKLAFDEQQQADGAAPLDLASRRIRATTAEQLMVAVANHPSLVCLTLNNCSDIGFAGLEMIGMHLPNTKLRELSLELSDEHKPSDKNKSVQQAFQRACQALMAGVQSSWHLHVLNLGDERYPSKVVEEIDFYVDLNKSGRYLLHDANSEEVPTGLWCHVLAKCGNKADFVYHHLREQPRLLLVAGMCHSTRMNSETRGPSVPVGAKRRRSNREVENDD